MQYISWAESNSFIIFTAIKCVRLTIYENILMFKAKKDTLKGIKAFEQKLYKFMIFSNIMTWSLRRA
jgi:hypothetical protein